MYTDKSFDDVLPLFFKIEGLTIKTQEIKPPKEGVDYCLPFRYTTIMSFTKFDEWALVDLYNEEKWAVANHFRWCMELPKIYIDMNND